MQKHTTTQYEGSLGLDRRHTAKHDKKCASDRCSACEPLHAKAASVISMLASAASLKLLAQLKLHKAAAEQPLHIGHLCEPQIITMDPWAGFGAERAPVGSAAGC